MTESNKYITVVIACLLAIGLVTSYSIVTAQNASREVVNQALMKQIILMLVGIGLLYVMYNTDYHILVNNSKIILATALILLFLVLILGVKINGSKRWFHFGPLSFQPSEIAKLAIAIYLADVLTKKQQRIKEFFHGFLPPVIVLGVSLILIMSEPDIGTAALIGTVSFLMLFVAGIRIIHVTPLILTAMPAVLYILMSSEKLGYIRARWEVFVNPELDPLGRGHQIIQSLLALGSGGMFGKGLGASQQKWFFLPEAKNDFIFAIIGEEFGFIGCAIVILLYITFMFQGFKIFNKAKDMFGALLAFSITLFVGLQGLINVAVVTRSLPPKGIPLPFVSSGGTSLALMMASIGILMNISKQSSQEKLPVVLGGEIVHPKVEE